MGGACPVPGPDDPLVQGLLVTTDCHVEALVRGGYGALFAPSGAFGAVLTTLLTVWVGLIGYRLLLGRSQLSIGEWALSAVKLGVVLALATQWGTYQTVVYRALFDGPRELSGAVMHGLAANGVSTGGDVFEGLQRAFDDLSAFSPASPPGAPAAAAAPAIPAALAAAAPTAATLPVAAQAGSNLLSKGGFDAMLLLVSAVVLLLSTLGVLLAAKIVLGFLLALGPVFLAALLFDSTRGVFEGWLRASLGFAFAPLAATVLLGVALSLLAPSLAEVETMRDQHVYTPGVAFGVLVLVLVIAAVSAGLLLAAALTAGGFRLPRPARGGGAATAPAVGGAPSEAAVLGRAERVAAAASAQARRDGVAAPGAAGAAGAALSGPGAASERRLSVEGPVVRATAPTVEVEARLGQAPRRSARPRDARAPTPREDLRTA